MGFYRRLHTWLETHWVAPAYSGWLMLGLALFFFAAATNTMAGWLYAISGVMFALMAIAAILPRRSLQQLQVNRRPIQPVSVGDPLLLELEIANQGKQPKSLLQVQDLLPRVLGKLAQNSIESIGVGDRHLWRYQQPTQRRGVYRWHTVELRTATPLGLFWSRRSHTLKATAFVYPQVLPLIRCPLVDQMGQTLSSIVQHNQRAQGATEGVTRTLRPYRWGDPTRLVHWRTSARYGELRVRELEIFTGGQEVVICLDSANLWQEDHFEQAVTAAASLYFYATRHAMQVSVWTAGTGLVRGDRPVLEVLAAVQSTEDPLADSLPDLPLVWLTQNTNSLSTLPNGSRWLLWEGDRQTAALHSAALTGNYAPGVIIQPNEPLQLQLQATL